MSEVPSTMAPSSFIGIEQRCERLKAWGLSKWGSSGPPPFLLILYYTNQLLGGPPEAAVIWCAIGTAGVYLPAAHGH